MESKVIQTLDQFIDERNGSVRESDAYTQLRAHFEAFEEYIRGEGFPDVVGLVNQVITKEVTRHSCPKLSVANPSYLFPGEKMLALTDNPDGLNNLYVSSGGLWGINFHYNDRGNGSYPAMHINTFGHNRTNWMELSKKGVEIRGYNIPKEVAETLVKDFDRVTGRSRNDVMLKLAESEDVTECYPKDYWVNYRKKEIKESGTTVTGIDENSVWTISRKGPEVAFFGNAHGYNCAPNIGLTMRIERYGVKFEFPKS